MKDIVGTLISSRDLVTEVFQAISAICFICSIAIALYQIRKTRKNQKEMTARNIFNDYLKQALVNSNFSYPPTKQHRISLERRTFDGSREKFERYEWFVSIMIFAMKELVEIHSTDVYWRLTVKRQLSYHRWYFAWVRTQDNEYNFVALAGQEINAIISELLRENQLLPPAAFASSGDVDVARVP